MSSRILKRPAAPGESSCFRPIEGECATSSTSLYALTSKSLRRGVGYTAHPFEARFTRSQSPLDFVQRSYVNFVIVANETTDRMLMISACAAADSYVFFKLLISHMPDS